jgi:drug/metabolite transporter (DMT)-like permease
VECWESGKEWQPEQLTARAALALVFLSVCGTAMAFGAYTWLLQVASPTLVGTYALVNPVVALGLAWLTGDEKASYRTAAAVGLILGAVLLTTRRENR